MKKIILKSIGTFINTTAIIVPKWSTDYAFKLLCKVRKAPLSTSGDEFFKKGIQTYLEVDGQSAVLHRWGNGSKNLLFLHGWMSNSQRWLPYYDRLDLNEYTMYALDAPGHGLSKTDALNIEIFRKAIEESLQLIGPIDTAICHSLSNTTMTYLSLVNPNVEIGKFVTMGAPTGMDAIFVYFKEMLGLSNKAMENLEVKIDGILKVSHEQIDIKNFFGNVTKPILVIHDKNDKVTPFPPIAEALKANPNIESMLTQGLAHDLKSEEVYNRVIEFIG